MKLIFLVLAMAGVNMRLEAGAIRELHWHKTAEVRDYAILQVRDLILFCLL